MYKVAYAKINNAGDLFNEAIMDYFDVKYQCSNVFNSNITMLGGMLSALLPSDKFKLRLAQKCLCLLNDTTTPLHVWGTGFLVGSREGELMRKNLEIHALRGELSQKKLEKLLNKNIDAVLCDPGLLASEFVSKNENSIYEVGIIPHFKEQTFEGFKEMLSKYPKSKIIDITSDYTTVLKEIAACRFIISSSLHGFIFADSMGIPNIHVTATKNLAGDGFKFRDYYSSFGLEHIPFDISAGEYPSLDHISDNYKINKSDVEQKIEQMISVFPKGL